MEDVSRKVDQMPISHHSHTADPAEKPAEKTKKSTGTGTIFVLAVVIIGIIAVFGDDIQTFLPEDEPVLEPADIQLYQFNDLVSNNSVNVEILVTNIGEKTATDIEIYVRARDHNGTIVYTEILPITALLLRGNETCSGTYTILIDDAEYLMHTIEISWEAGRNTYTKKTILA